MTLVGRADQSWREKIVVVAVDTVVGTGGGGDADADAATTTTTTAQMPRHSDDDCRSSSTMSMMRDSSSKGTWRTRASWFLRMDYA